MYSKLLRENPMFKKGNTLQQIYLPLQISVFCTQDYHKKDDKMPYVYCLHIRQ